MSRSPRPLTSLSVAVVVMLLIASCGFEGAAESGGSPTAVTRQPAWTAQVLDAVPGTDVPLQVGTAGDQAVVLVVTDDGRITGFASGPDGRFRAGEPTETQIPYLSLGEPVWFGDEWLAPGSSMDDDDGGARVLRSADGLTWSQQDVPAFDEPANVFSMVERDDGLVAVGTRRTADDPRDGGFRPAVWHSADGERWSEAALPGVATKGSVHAVVATDRKVLAIGRAGRAGTLWSSTDRGATWSVVEPQGIPNATSLDDIAAQGEVVVASGLTGAHHETAPEGVPILVRSADSGRTWREVTEPPPSNHAAGHTFSLFSGGGRFFALGYSYIDAWSEPEICYADVERCRQDTVIALYVSDDGDRWQRVDTSGIGEGDAGEIDAVVVPDDGRVIAVTDTGTDVGTWTWPAGVPLPTMAEPIDPTSDVDLLSDDEMPQPGRRYGVPLYVHCGMGWLHIGGEPWQRTDDGPDVETGTGDEIPDGWPVARETIFGYVTLVDDDLIEYAIADGEVIATYAPATEDPPGCA